MTASPSGKHATKRWTLRALAILFGVLAVIDLVITVLPMPAPPRPEPYSIGPGSQRVIYTSYSDSDVATIRMKNWVQLYLNPVGWVATMKGTDSSTLYELKRGRPGWKSALEIGQSLSLGVLMLLSPLLWILSYRVGRKE